MGDITDEPVYQLIDVQKRFDDFLLHIHGLKIARNMVLGLLGPTGAGKSTLLRLLAGLDEADSGTLKFQNQRLSPRTLTLETRRCISLVHQRPILLSGTVLENVEYGLRVRGRQSCAELARAMLKRFNLSAIAGQSSSTLSGGQTQLVSLARALVIEPDVLLLDEPTSHLDPAHVALVEKTIREMQQERNMTVVWATHNLFQARRVANRTALLLNGKLVEEGPTDRFFTSPRDPRTADFVNGRMIY